MAVSKEAVEQKLAEHREKRQRVLKQKVVKAEQAAMVAAMPRKKLLFERAETGLYFLSFAGGGELPESLKGGFTSVNKMMQAINKYGDVEVDSK